MTTMITMFPATFMVPTLVQTGIHKSGYFALQCSNVAPPSEEAVLGGLGEIVAIVCETLEL